MGSYGDVWLNCAICGLRGKCLMDMPPNIPSLIDVDGMGPLCDPCFDLAHPRLIMPLLVRKLNPQIANLVERFWYLG